MGIGMKDLANELLLKLLKTPAVAEQVRKSLVNRDISVNIDGKEYQLLRKQPTDDEVVRLKAKNYDLTQALEAIVKAADEDNQSGSFWQAIRHGKKVLGLFD